ncbi:MAG: S9 family peptidase [Pseudomonadales bacterium]|jgi:dipeptidyl-peptidase-4|nr:S9 family peptidase [Pseudomonadales bacterium]
MRVRARSRRPFPFLFVLLCLPAPFGAAEDATPPLTIERVYGSPDLSGPRPRALRFSPDGSRVTFLRPKEEDRTVLDLWAMDVAEGEPYRLVDARVLAPEERELSEAEIQLRERARISQTGIVRYDWDESGEAILVPLDGDVFFVDVASGEARRLMETEAFETDAKISPAGGYVSFVREQNLWVHELATGRERPITTEGGGLVSFGMAEFVAQEEMKRDTGYWWSPDDRLIAVARVDESPVEVVQRFGIGAEGVTVTEQRYPRAGTANAIVELQLYDVESGERVDVDLGDDADIYLARVDWSADGSVLWVQRQNRAQTRLDLLAADPETGATRIELAEQAPTWINLSDDLTPLEDGGFLWTSERSGFRHIFRYRPDGRIEMLTLGSWVVDEISGVDEERGLLWFEGWMTTPLERHLYELPLAGGRPRRITDGEGWWNVEVGDDGEAFLGTYSDPDTPPHTALYRMDGERIAWIVENALDATHPYGPWRESHLTPEFGTLPAADGGTALQWMLYRPQGCTAASPCPAIVQVYGGPGSQTVRRAWQSPRDQLYARAGYVLFKLDNRGMGNRGHAFEAAIHDRMGTVEVQDQLAGLAFLKNLPFVDGERVGLYGWSYGGYMTLMTALQAPDAFAAAVAGAPVTDWSLYDTHYTERYMDTPQGNAAGYEAGAVFAHLPEGYATPLLLIHGMADDNVTFDQSTRLYAALQEQGALFEMMTYPGQRHGIRPPPLQVHLQRTITDFFARRLGGPSVR